MVPAFEHDQAAAAREIAERQPPGSIAER